MNLHGQIMNIPAEPAKVNGSNYALSYKEGHRDARHAAAELSLVADKMVEALRGIAGKDPAELARDPLWAARVARIALTECGFDL